MKVLLAALLLASFLHANSAAAECTSGSYSPPSTPLYLKGGFLEEESGIVKSRKQDGVFWLHNDNYDKKYVYAIRTTGANAGRVLTVLDLEDLPGINQYSDFEDIAIANCPFQDDLPSEDQRDCIFVGDSGNNAEWDKGEFVYAVPEPDVSEDSFRRLKPEEAVVLRLIFPPDEYGYHKGPNVEAFTAAPDGKMWMFHKTMSHGGDGPAEIWESPSLRERPRHQDACSVDTNGTWLCDLGDRPESDLKLRSHRFRGAEIVSSRFASIRADEGPIKVSMYPIHMEKIASLTNPKPECPSCVGPLKDIRNIAGADLSEDGSRLLIATYGGIWIYKLGTHWDMSTLDQGTQVTTTNRDGSAMFGGGKFWSGQEGVAWSGDDIISVSEHHKRLYKLTCLD